MKNDELISRREAEFDGFYKSVLGALVDFVDSLGIRPSQEVLNHAAEYAENIALAIDDMAIESDDDRLWLLGRMGYFIGEYFAQKFQGSWFVNDVEESKFYTRYVVGRFARKDHGNLMIDPFQIAQEYVDTECPRNLIQLLNETEAELVE